MMQKKLMMGLIVVLLVCFLASPAMGARPVVTKVEHGSNDMISDVSLIGKDGALVWINATINFKEGYDAMCCARAVLKDPHGTTLLEEYLELSRGDGEKTIYAKGAVPLNASGDSGTYKLSVIAKGKNKLEDTKTVDLYAVNMAPPAVASLEEEAHRIKYIIKNQTVEKIVPKTEYVEVEVEKTNMGEVALAGIIGVIFGGVLGYLMGSPSKEKRSKED